MSLSIPGRCGCMQREGDRQRNNPKRTLAVVSRSMQASVMLTPYARDETAVCRGETITISSLLLDGSSHHPPACCTVL